MANDDRLRIAAEVRAAMARHTKTQDELAAQLGIDQAAVSLRLQGKRSFRAEELAVISRWLATPVSALIPSEVAA